MTTFGSTRMIALALAGASVIAMATPADAAWRGRNTAAAAGIGFAAGALIGGAVAASQPRAYYGDGYGYYEPAPTYYQPAPTYYGSPYESYGYETAPTYYAPSPNYYRATRNRPGLGTDYNQRP